MNPRRNRRRARGMTLIDVLVAIAVLCIGSMGMMAAALTLLMGSAQARLLTDATAVARAAMERLLLQATPTAGADVVDRAGCASGRGCVQQTPLMLFTRTWTVTQNASGQNQLVVQVTYNDSSGMAHQVVLNALR